MNKFMVRFIDEPLPYKVTADGLREEGKFIVFYETNSMGVRLTIFMAQIAAIRFISLQGQVNADKS